MKYSEKMNVVFNKCYKVMISAKYYFKKRDKNVWVFTEWFGKKSGDNCTYFANYVVNHCQERKVYWIYEKGADLSFLDEKIVKLQKDSPEAIAVLKKAAVVGINQGIAELSNIGNFSGNAIKINLWHGVMWKKLGYDIKGGASKADRIKALIKNYSNNCYLYESPSDEYTKVLINSFLAKNSEIIKAGQPRNSLFFNDEAMRKAKEKIVCQLQMLTEVNISNNTKIVTYMPTFRDQTDLIFDFTNFIQYDVFIKYLIQNDIILVQKTHFVTNERGGAKVKDASGRIITNGDIDAQYLLASSDMLITDYSSCFFDYLLLDRPVIHFMYDYDYYCNDDRGLYYKYEDVVCGDAVFEESNLMYSITSNIENPEKNKELRLLRRNKYQQYESEKSCETIVKAIEERMSVMR